MLPVKPGKTTGQQADNKRRRTVRRKYRLIAAKLFYATDGDLIQWWERAPDGDKSDVLRESIRDYLARLKAAPKPATDHDVIRQADRVLAYAEQVTQWAASALAEQQAVNAGLTEQLASLTRQITELSAKLATGNIMIGTGQSTNNQTAADPPVPRLTAEQAAERLKKVKARKW